MSGTHVSWQTLSPAFRDASRAWMPHAACAGDLGWLNRDPETQLADCRGCPVRLQCLAYAIDTRATDVTMGGIVIGAQPVAEAVPVVVDAAELRTYLPG